MLAPQLTLEQKQLLKLSPQMLQSFELMMLPLQELQARISDAIESNPALEIPESTSISYEDFTRMGFRDRDSMDDSLTDSASYGSDIYDGQHYRADGATPGEARGYDENAMQRQNRMIDGVLTQKESLQEHLFKQLNLHELTRRQRHIAELIISNLDANGFHTLPVETLEDGLTQEDVAPVVSLLQSFDPSGIAVTDFRESLVVQARNDGLEAQVLDDFSRLVYDALELMRPGKEAEAAKMLKLDPDEVSTLYAYLRSLTPFPGQAYNTEPDQFVIPDLSIHVVDGSLEMRLNQDALPALTINTQFTGLGETLKERKDDPSSKETVEYIQKMSREASVLISQIHLRNQTLHKVGLALIKLQSDFFFKGPRYLRPMTLKNVAEEVGVHETTISRISQAKWMDTDWGFLPLKQMFSTGVATSGGSTADMSRTSVKEIIREIIDESENKRLSDQKISDLLAKKGISVARRTVAKYRKELDIDSSFGR
ncbi:RNA polymerase factor sigma-54 [Parasphaerochaeta coccoides]|nr:RNA polymerase factor sigma-54 [Parasphaerochaeta coccoides]